MRLQSGLVFLWSIQLYFTAATTESTSLGDIRDLGKGEGTMRKHLETQRIFQVGVTHEGVERVTQAPFSISTYKLGVRLMKSIRSTVNSYLDISLKLSLYFIYRIQFSVRETAVWLRSWVGWVPPVRVRNKWIQVATWDAKASPSLTDIYQTGRERKTPFISVENPEERA